MRDNFDGHDVTSPYDGVPRPMLHVKYSKCLNSRARLHTGEKWQTTLELKRYNLLLRLQEKKDVLSGTFYHIARGRSNNPSLSTDKREFGSPVITGEI